MIYMERRFSQVFVHPSPGTQATCGCAHCNTGAQPLTVWVSMPRCMDTEIQGQFRASAVHMRAHACTHTHTQPHTHTHTDTSPKEHVLLVVYGILNLLTNSSLVPTSSFRPEGFSYNNRSQNPCSHLETPKHMRSPQTSCTLQCSRIC